MSPRPAAACAQRGSTDAPRDPVGAQSWAVRFGHAGAVLRAGRLGPVLSAGPLAQAARVTSCALHACAPSQGTCGSCLRADTRHAGSC